MRSRCRFSAITIPIVCLVGIVISTVTTRAHAGTPLSRAQSGASTNPQSTPVVVADGAGGMFAAWFEAGAGVYALRLTPDGYAAPGWPSGGVLMSAGYRDNVSIVADGSGGAYVAFDTGDYYGSVGLTHVDAAGGQLAMWTGGDPQKAVGVSTYSDSSGRQSPQKSGRGESHPAIAPDGAGGVFFAWMYTEQRGLDQTFLQRFSFAGAVTPVWSAAVSIAYAGYFPTLAPDGSGGVFVAWVQSYPSRVGVNHFTASGALAPGWITGGENVCDAAIAQSAPGIVTDGAAGAIIAWADSRDNTRNQIFAQRVVADGSTVWPSNGICVCSQPSDFGPNRFGWYGVIDGRRGSLVADGSGGALAVWVDHRDAATTSANIYAQRIAPDGAIATGWPIDGLAVCATAGDQLLPAIASDGRGGAFVAWLDGRTQMDWTLRSHRLDASGQIASDEPADGVVLSATPDPGSLPVLAPDGANGAFGAWVDRADSIPSIQTAHLAAGGVQPVRPALVVKLSSDVNPARIGRTITLTAAVQPTPAAGTVDFFELGRRFASVPLVGGVATVQYSPASTGTRTLTATYTGDATYAPSSDYIVQRVIPLDRTTLMLTADVNPTLVGRTIMLTTTVQPSTASGTVDLFDSGARIATLTLAGGVATMGYALPPSPALLTITASYSGDTASAVSNATLYEYVYERFPVRVAVAGSMNPSTSLDVTLTAWVAPVAAPGSVTFSDESGTLATVPLVNGIATLPYHAPSFRTRTITASYPGNSEYTAGDGTCAEQFVGRFTSMDVASSANPASVDQAITLMAHVAPATATGTVNFTYSGTQLGSSALENGVARLQWQSAVRGVGIVTADYSGDTTYSGTWNQLPLEILGPSSTTTLASSGSWSVAGSLVKLTATVAPPLDSGTVTIYVDSVAHVTSAVIAGVAEFTTSTLQPGQHTLYGEYSGSSVYRSSRSAGVSFQVLPVSGPYLRVLAPNDGEAWNVGLPAEIRWDASNAPMVRRVSLYVSRTLSPPNWQTIAENVPNTGSYTWMVTGPGTNLGSNPAASALVSVVDYSGTAGSDESDFPFSIIDHPTPAVVTRFDAEPIDTGVRVSWALADPTLVASLELQRSRAEVGPWTAVAAVIRDEAGVSVAEDATVEPGWTYWYRLLATERSGTQAILGPITVSARGPKAFALSAAWPNPTRGPLALEFSVATQSRVKLDLVDPMGREVTVLAESEFPPGRYRVDWDGRTANAVVRPGVYFVQLITSGKRFVSRVTIVP